MKSFDTKIKRDAKTGAFALRQKKPKLRPPEDPDNMPITEADIKSGKLTLVRRRGRPVGSDKEQVTVRLDRDVLEALKKDGRGWQTRMNATLRDSLGLDE